MELRAPLDYDGYETSFERDIKRVVHIDWFTDKV